MASSIHKSSKSSRYSEDRVTDLQILQSTLKWHKLEQRASSLLDVFAGILNYQAIILSINSSYVDPLMQFETQLTMIESAFKMVFAIPSLDKVKELGNIKDEEEDLEELHQSILNTYEDTLLILVSKDLYKLQLLKEMVVWMSEDTFYQQERVMVIITRVLNFASRKVKGYASVDAPCLGVLAAELSLLCSHTNPFIVQQACLGMYHLLCIAKCQNENTAQNKAAMCKKSASFMSSFSDTAFLPSLLQGEKTKTAQSIGQILPPTLLTDFVWNLLVKLSAPDQETKKEAAIMLLLTLESHAHKVTRVSMIVDTIYEELCGNPMHTLKDTLLQVITLLTYTSPKKVIFQLMDYPVPADNTLILMWQAASVEPSVAPHVLKTLLLILKGKPGEMQDSLADRRRFSLDMPNMMPVAASQALCSLLPVSSYKKAVAQFFPQLLMALIFQLSYTSNMSMLTQNIFYAQDALRVLLNCSGLEPVDLALKRKNFWDQISQVLFHHHGVYLIAKKDLVYNHKGDLHGHLELPRYMRTLGDYKFPQFPETLQYLYKLSVDGPRRSEDSVITIIFLTELLNKFFKDPFPEEFLVLFKNWVNDSNPAVSKLSLQKIADMAPVINEIENVSSLLLSILDAFLSKDKTVVIRALLTLRRVLNKLNKVTYSSLCTKIASSYGPLMDHSNGGIRSMASRHFGELFRDMSEYRWMLNNMVLTALVPLILFLEDPETRVVSACKHTLQICASELNWSTVDLLMDQNYNFELVVQSICNNIFIPQRSAITDLLSKSLGFLRSSRAYLRRASVILTGYLATLGSHLLVRDDIEVMLEAIEPVLRDENPMIRELAQKTHKVFEKIGHKLTSSNVKQAFQRLFDLLSKKKLKLLYNYNSPSKHTGETMEIQEAKNVKKTLSKEL